jgi:hypothetical protein
LNVDGLLYAPINELGVVYLFGLLAKELGFLVETIQAGFPDCIARRKVGKRFERVGIEFEFESRNFHLHKHPAEGCDVIVCWKDNWPQRRPDLGLEVIALEKFVKENPPPRSPGDKRLDLIQKKLFSANPVEKGRLLAEFQRELGGISDAEVGALVGFRGGHVGLLKSLLLLPEKTQKLVVAGAINCHMASLLWNLNADAHRKALADILSGKVTTPKQLVARYGKFRALQPGKRRPAARTQKKSLGGPKERRG